MWVSKASYLRNAPDCARSARLLALLLAFLCLMTLPAGAASVTATLLPEVVPVGESATLTLEIQGGQPASLPAFPAIPGLQISSAGQSRNISIINNDTTETLSFQFNVTPLKEGEFVIPALTLSVAGQKLTTPALKLTAGKATAAGESPLISMRLQVVQDNPAATKTNFFIGEMLTVELDVLVHEGIANAAQVLQWFEQNGASLMKAEGGTVLKSGHGQRARVQQGNAVYTVARIFASVTFAKTGRLTVNAEATPLNVQLPTRGQRRRDGFDLFGMFEQYQTRTVVPVSTPLEVAILPLPTQNVPPGFNGAVGSYTITAMAGPTNVAVGDPVTVKFQITGKGNLEALPAPGTADWKDFKSYPPTSRVDPKDLLATEGTKTFEQVVVPQLADVTAIPTAFFSFFDPADKTYRTLQTDPIPLTVRPVGSQAAPTVAITRGQQESTPAADIVHIKPRMKPVVASLPPLVQRPWFYALQLIPLLTLAGTVIWRKRTDAFARNPRLVRRRKVDQLVREGLANLDQLASANRSDDFFAGLFHLLQERLGERLDLPASAITEAVIDEHLRPRQVSDELLSELEGLFQACNQARYAPVRTSQELQGYMASARRTFDHLDTLEL